MSFSLAESDVEDVALQWLEAMGYSIVSGEEFAAGGPSSERSDFGQVVLVERLRSKLEQINLEIPASAIDDAVWQVLRADEPSLIARNRRFHKMLTDGVDVEFQRADGSLTADKVWLIDFKNPENNEFLAVNQFTIIENKRNRRPDVLLFVNGIPLAVIELKNAADAETTVRHAFNQIQTYKRDIPALFAYNAISVASDSLSARIGALTGDWERFMPWRTIDGDEIAPRGTLELETLIKGVFDRSRFLELIRHFIVFEDDGAAVVKKMAGYHQFHAVKKAVQCTIQASSPSGDKRVGVIWHTQGSGKSLSMVFYAGKIVNVPEMANPTIVVITDRNDLDDQLFGTFARCKDLVRQTPVQAENREELRDLLKVASGGVVFSTIQKFLPDSKGERYPMLSTRRNIVVIADEAHRSQYAFIDGLARNLRDALPNASFIGFTGTPIESSDRSTPAVFGDYIDVYDIQRAVEDGATVRIYYESRLANIELDPDEKPKLDASFEEVTEGEEQNRREKLKTKWAALEALVGAEKRIDLLAKDIVDHFEKRLEAMEGEAMIVCMSQCQGKDNCGA